MLHRLTRNGSARDFLYDGEDLVVEYVEGVVARRYVHAPGANRPLVWYEGSGTADQRYLHADERGSIIAVASSSGTQTHKYSPYGESEAPGPNSFGYTGQLWLNEIGLYYYKARMYSPELGRFLQPDPIGYAAGLNLYAYVGGDPINFTGPTGLARHCIWRTISGVGPTPLTGQIA
ncbi:MAG: hypothetical protein DIU71_06995 [Proteobacteria bacterium]|nr:MAG: hypothetical protein DIU71_06995 [Pseudomonadota bacterium]